MQAAKEEHARLLEEKLLGPEVPVGPQLQCKARLPHFPLSVVDSWHRCLAYEHLHPHDQGQA